MGLFATGGQQPRKAIARHWGTTSPRILITISFARAGESCDLEVMRKIGLPLARTLSLVLWLFAACDSAEPQTAKTGGSKTGNSHAAVSCTKDSQCPSGQRCGFTSGCESKGKCITPSNDTHCIDPGGRCGCDGRPVDIVCAVGSPIEFTSAPVNAVGPCPRPCTEQLGCGSSGLTCEKGLCIKR